METYAHESLPQAAALLEADKCTFSVLSRILKGTCERIITENHRLIICYSQSPFPVWIWMPEDTSESEMERARQILRAEFPCEEGFRYCAKYDFARRMVDWARQAGRTLRIEKNLLAYACPKPVAPKKHASGHFCTASADALELAVQWDGEMRIECGAETLPAEVRRADLARKIEDRMLFLWKDGESTAVCYLHEDEDMMGISGVYTPPAMRRRGYAANLIYEVSRLIRAQGKMPALYTDADYAASNACYTQIGYQRQGSLCTLSSDAAN